jgi:predicted transcriptional regulator
MAEQLQEVTVRMSAKLFAKISRLADEAYESRDTYIESALAHIVREVSAAKRHMQQVEQLEVAEPELQVAGQYL